MLPKTVADDLKYNKSTSEMFESATILFSEIEGFNDLARCFIFNFHNLLGAALPWSCLICSTLSTRPLTRGLTSMMCTRWAHWACSSAIPSCRWRRSMTPTWLPLVCLSAMVTSTCQRSTTPCATPSDSPPGPRHFFTLVTLHSP